MSERDVIEAIEGLGLKRLEINPVDLAHLCVDYSTYRRGAKSREAPETVDCSSLIKWMFGECGVWLPRRTIQQREEGLDVSAEFRTGDVLFSAGVRPWFHDHPDMGVGHAGLYIGDGRVIHAANTARGVVEDSVEDFLGTHPGSFRGARRYLNSSTVVFELPKDLDVETSDDLRWILLARAARST